MNGRGNNQHVWGYKKRCNILRWKYTIIVPHHEHTPRGGGASEGCRPKLPRWPFSGSGCTQTSGTAVHESMVGSHARRVKLFCAASRIFGAPRAANLVIPLLPPSSVLAPSP